MKWLCKECNKELTYRLCDELGVLPAIAMILIRNGYTNVSIAEPFLYPKLTQIKDPFLVKNLEEGANRLLFAIEQKQKVFIVGDYDVDGVTSVSLLVSYLKRFSLKARYFLPRRKEDGYGLSDVMVDRIISERGFPDLLVLLDCGTNALEQIKRFRDAGVDILIIDHHHSKTENAPDAILVNPNSSFSESSEWAYLCTAGLVFKLIHGVTKLLREKGNEQALKIILKEYLDFVALGTIADLSPLIGENRIMTFFGLKQLKQTQRIGLRALIRSSKIADTADILPVDVSHRIGPRINASGRLGDPVLPASLFLCDNQKRCNELANKLSEINKNRQIIEKEVWEEARFEVERQNKIKTRMGLVVCGDWHLGVVGIIAGKMARQYNCPSIVMWKDGDIARGSGRSVEGINLIEMVEPFSNKLDSWGGHPMAIGISIELSKLDEFRDFFDNAVRKAKEVGQLKLGEKNLNIAAYLKKSDLTEELFDQITLLSPFGEGNPEPIFAVKDIDMPADYIIFGEENYRFQIPLQNGARLSLIAWSKADNIPMVGQKIDIALKLSWNNYNGRKYQQAEIIDWKYSK